MIVKPYISAVADPISLVEAKLHLRVDQSTDDVLIASQINAATEWCEKYEGQAYMARSMKAYLDGFQNEIQLPFPPLLSVDSVQYYDTGGTLQTMAASYYTVDTDSVPGRVYLAFSQSWPSTYLVPKSVVITYTAGYATTFSVSATDITNNTLTLGNTLFEDGDIVRVYTDQSDLPSPLAVNTNYYVRDTSGSTIKLATTSGGDAVDIADAGTGTHQIAFADRGGVPERVKAAIKLITGHLYENREETADVLIRDLPFSVKNLLMERVWH